MNRAELKEKIKNSFELFCDIYGENNAEGQTDRYLNAVDKFCELYGESDNLQIFSAPGRTEICGNHTDHNLGCVVAGSVNLDVIAVTAPNESGIIKVKSEGYDEDVVEISDTHVHEEEINKSNSLIRGTVAHFSELGHKVGGFCAYTTTNVLKGSGLSSSAAFESLIGTILNGLYNDMSISPVEIAKTAQYAENEYFKKPCGLMDQMASAVGGIITIDFKDKENPKIEKIDFDFEKQGYALCIVDTGGNHADLTNEYASIPYEMKSVAKFFGKNVLREITKNDVIENITALRKECGDRAVLRALHFFDENENVLKQKEALLKNDFDSFLYYSKKSGNSSYKYLQNVYANIAPDEQGISLALYMAEDILQGRGACRVHGGGFGGTTQNFVPNDMVNDFKTRMEKVFGKGKCHILNIRKYGGIKVL